MGRLRQIRGRPAAQGQDAFDDLADDAVGRGGAGGDADADVSGRQPAGGQRFLVRANRAVPDARVGRRTPGCRCNRS